MKSVLVLALFAAAPAMAISPGDGSGAISDQAAVQYLSWCDSNSVIAQDAQGNLYVRANCDEGGLVCKTTQFYRAGGSIVSASCKQKQK